MIQWGRGGSTVHGNLRAQDPSLQADGEIFSGRLLMGRQWEKPTAHNLSPCFPQAPINWPRRRLKAPSRPLHGFEVEPWHIRLNGMTFPGFLSHVTLLSFDRFVLLSRRSHPRRVVSARVAHARQT